MTIIVVDVQEDFTVWKKGITVWKKGSLSVPGTDKVYVKEVNDSIKKFRNEGHFIIATRDWHPNNHVSFSIWPEHCVQGTKGARLSVKAELIDRIIDKGMDPNFDSYSAVRDNGGKDTGLIDLLQEIGTSTIKIFGIATDYCVKATAIDLVREGFGVFLVGSLCRGVYGVTTKAAIQEMKKEGVVIL